MEFLLTSTSGWVENQIPNAVIKKYTKIEVRGFRALKNLISDYLGWKAIGFLKELIIKCLKVEYKENSRTVQRGILSKSIR
ncbi:Uncharacterised protein [Streptococcus pneumoniae]|nr:hypothetical protein IPP24_00024 [Streptococcus phage IPP24]KXV98616.1 hypothetical protein NTPn6_02760 [Streptococcus pneumoniae]OCQ80013.1 hypothetical protein A4257_02105 [Streptococcus pneumoniae]VIR00778.1 Uncharacterised protein [Streptococcus pneumoniae]VJA54351.1 Uncharacterised protein [Streptococcus pneumoniae]